MDPHPAPVAVIEVEVDQAASMKSEHCFLTLREAQLVIEAWRREY